MVITFRRQSYALFCKKQNHRHKKPIRFSSSLHCEPLHAKKAGKETAPCPLFFAINKLACSIRLLHHDLLTVMNIQSLCRWLTAETAPCRSYHAAADSSFITLNTSLIEVVSPSPKFSTKALAPLVSRSPAEMPLCCRRWPRLPSAPLRY